MKYIITRVDGNGKKYYLKNGTYHDSELHCAVYQWTPNKRKAWHASRATANTIACSISERYKPEIEVVPEYSNYISIPSTTEWFVTTVDFA